MTTASILDIVANSLTGKSVSVNFPYRFSNKTVTGVVTEVNFIPAPYVDDPDYIELVIKNSDGAFKAELELDQTLEIFD